MIEHLERINLFLVPLDEERHWFRYHHLFADVLRRKSNTIIPKSQVNLFYQRASEWLEEGFIHEAVHCALQIADQLFLSRGTVNRHLFNIYQKLGVHSRTQALSKAKELGLWN